MALDHVIEAFKAELRLALGWKSLGMKLVPSCATVHLEQGRNLVPVDEYISFWEDTIKERLRYNDLERVN